MKKLIHTTQKQMLRGSILRICNELPATGAGTPLMLSILKQKGSAATADDIADACYYLQCKGLITLKNFKSDTLQTERDIAYITANGIDVLDGTTEIDGITI